VKKSLIFFSDKYTDLSSNLEYRDMSTLAQYEKLIQSCAVQTPETTPEPSIPELSYEESEVLKERVEKLKAQIRRIVDDFAAENYFPVTMHSYGCIDESIDEAFYHETGV